MNKSEREELKRLAEAAIEESEQRPDEEPWFEDGWQVVMNAGDADHAFVVKCNPAAIQSLLAYVDRLEAQRDLLLVALKGARADIRDGDVSKMCLRLYDEAITEAESEQ